MSERVLGSRILEEAETRSGALHGQWSSYHSGHSTGHILFLQPLKHRGDELGDFCSCGRKKKNLSNLYLLTMNEVDYLLFRNVCISFSMNSLITSLTIFWKTPKRKLKCS